MAKIKRLGKKELGPITPKEIEMMFDELSSRQALKRYEPIEFMVSLNLTREQYDKLRSIIEDFGYERWDEGNSSGYEQGCEMGSPGADY